MGEFQSLCRVDGHKPDALTPRRSVPGAVKRHVRQIGGGVGFLAAADLKIVDGLLQLRQIVQPILVALGPQRQLIAAGVQNAGEQLGDGEAAGGGCISLDQGDECRRLRAAEDLVVQRLPQGGIERAAMLRGVSLQEGDAPLT